DSGRSAATAAGLGPVQHATEGAIVAPRAPSAKSRWLVLAFCASVALLLIAAGWIVLNRRRHQRLPTPRVVPFTGLSGYEDQATFSPDGNQLAFTSREGAGDVTHIYVKLIGAGTPLRLTNSTKSDFSPVWSPDGRYIAFARQSSQGYDVLSVPSLGGPERQLRHADTLAPPPSGGEKSGLVAGWETDRGGRQGFIERPLPHLLYLSRQSGRAGDHIASCRILRGH